MAFSPNWYLDHTEFATLPCVSQNRYLAHVRLHLHPYHGLELHNALCDCDTQKKLEISVWCDKAQLLTSESIQPADGFR